MTFTYLRDEITNALACAMPILPDVENKRDRKIAEVRREAELNQALHSRQDPAPIVRGPTSPSTSTCPRSPTPRRTTAMGDRSYCAATIYACPEEHREAALVILLEHLDGSASGSGTSPTTGSASCCTVASPGTLTARHGSEAGHHVLCRRAPNGRGFCATVNSCFRK
jgi:hypothetical protein